MDEYKDSNRQENENEGNWAAPRYGSSPALTAAVIVLIVLCVVAFSYGYHQKSMVNQATAQAASANASVAQMQTQVDALTARLNSASAAQTPAPAQQPAATPEPASSPEPGVDVASQTPAPTTARAPVPAAHAKHSTAKHHVAKRHAPVDKKYEQLQAQLADQQKQLKDTQDEVAKDRTDLESSINSTRDDLNSTRDNLNGSIAKTHDELVTLEKRGERAYFEFDLNKSKQFARVGPLTLSLRKADTKHKSYDLAMIVDDNELQKKKVNLFEPVWIHDENESQPVQIVVNKIDKDHVHGYISAPKYKPSDLATTGAGSASMTPVSAKTPAAATSNAPDQQQQPRP